jgi:hypothetical protein
MDGESFTPRPVDEDRPSQEEKSPRWSEPPPSPPPPRKPSPADRKLKEAVSGVYGTVGLVIAATAGENEQVQAAGIHVVNTADAAADAWMELAGQNAKVKKALQRFTEGTSFAGLVGVHVAMFAPLAAARGFIPEKYAPVVMAMSGGVGGNGGL